MESETATNPALDTARAELKDIATNPQNPRHAGYHRGDSQVSAYLDGLYKKALPTDVPVEREQGVSLNGAEHMPHRDPDQGTTMSLEDRQAHSEIDTMLRRTFGDGYDTEMSNMRVGAQHLFSIDGGEKVLAEFSALITALGPLAEVRGIRFLGEIGQLIKQQQGGRT